MKMKELEEANTEDKKEHSDVFYDCAKIFIKRAYLNRVLHPATFTLKYLRFHFNT